MKLLLRLLLSAIVISFSITTPFAQTSWKGTTSTAWNVATNWTNGVPTATVPAILGDASFTGVNQPTVNATASCKGLTVGGAVPTTLTLTKNLSVVGNVLINSNATITHPASTMSLTGTWTNSGTYNATSTTSSIIFSGTVQSINGPVITNFRKLTINAGSVLTLNTNFTCTGASSLISLSGTLNPNEGPTYIVTTDNLTVNSGGILKVHANTLSGNYVISTTTTLSAGSIVEYGATTTNQVVSSAYSYSTLRISGASTIKTLAADLPLLRSTSSSVGNIYVLSGTLDLNTFLANRGTTVAGGTVSVSAGATLKIGGTNAFPTPYTTTTLALTSTVEYNGTDQPVTAKTYGNLILSSAAGAVTKTMPTGAFTVAGSLTSQIGNGTSVAYTAGANISVTGSFNIGASTTFSGATFSHGVTGNWNNNGTFNPGTSTITLKGANSLITGNAVQDFNNLTITGSNVTSPTITDINIAGNLATSGSGSFIQPATSTLKMSGTTKTIAGIGIQLGNLQVTGVVTTSASFVVAGNVNVSNSLIASGGIITMNGAGKTITNSGVLTFRGLLTSGSITTANSFTVSSSLNCSGSLVASAGTITFTGTNLLSGSVNLFNITVAATSLSLAANANLGIAGSFAITAGSFNTTSYVPNTVNYNGNGAQTIKNATYNNLILSNSGTKTASAAFTVNNTLTISPSVTLDAATFTHTIVGNWINNGSFIPGTSTIQFTGAINSNITGVTAFNNVTINKSLATYTVNLLSNVSVNTINMTQGVLSTGSNSITILTTRTGNGIILGTITRTHTFVAGTAYAFEGPNNLVTFAAGMSGVTTVTINVTIAAVADFPFGGAIGRTYTISIPSGSYTAILRLHYEDAELNGNNESIMQLWRNPASAWAVVGKTSNNTTTNYVEKTAIGNLNGRWSMTDDGSVLSWNGSVSSDWNTPGNWSLVQGTFSGVPAGTDLVQIGITGFTNQPVITTSAIAKAIVFGSVQPVDLTLNTGGSLVTNGGISGTWTSDATHSINVNAQTVTINGDLSLSDNNSNHSINLSVSTGTVNVVGTLVETGAANINISGAGNLNIGKDFTYSGGTFTPGTGTVKYNGTVSQIVAAVPYYNLTIAKTAGTVATLSTASNIAGSLTVTTGEFDAIANMNISGSVSVGAASVLNTDGATVTVGGNWTKNATGTFTPGNGTVVFNGGGTQTISAGAFNILTFQKASGSAVLSGNNTVSGNLSLLAGTLNLSTFTLNQSSAGDIFTVADGTTLLLSGANNFPSNFSSYVIGANSLVTYNGTVAQLVADLTYGHLSFLNGSSLEKTFIGPAVVNGNITINSSTTVNSGGFPITLAGNWTNSGTFVPGTGDMILNGIAKTITGNTVFNDFTVNGSYSVTNSDLTFNGTFQVTPTGDYVAGSGVATVNGDFTNAGSVSSSGTTTFSGTVLQTIRLINALQSTSTGIVNFNGNVSPVLNSTSAPIYATLNINNTAGINPSVNWLIQNTFTISNGGIFNGGIYTHTIRRDFTNDGTVTSSGTLRFVPTTAVTLKFSGTNFSSSGTVNIGGTGAVTISGTPTSLQDVIISNTNAAGVTTPSGWSMNGKFSVNSNSIFRAGPYTYTVGGDIESDGTLEGGSSVFNMTSTSGMLTASALSNFNDLTITGNITPETDFRVQGNFTNNGVYDGSIGVLIMNGNNNATIGGTTTPSTIQQLNIEKPMGVTVTQDVNMSDVSFLNIFSGTLYTGIRTITQDPGGGVLIINDDATLKLGGTNSLPGFSGYGLGKFSNVDYAGGVQAIGNAVDYGNLIISAVGNKNAFVPVVVRNNLTISAGTFATSTVSVTHSVAGDFTMTGGSISGTSSTFLLNGSTDQTITLLSNLVNLTVNKPTGQVLLGSGVTVNQVLNLMSGKVSLGNYDLTMGTSGSITNYSALKYIVANGNGSLIQRVVNGGGKLYPVGSTVYYLPATVALTPSSTSDNISVRPFPGLHKQGLVGDEYTFGVVANSWAINEAVPGGSDATITLQWPGALELSAFSRNNCRLFNYTGPNWNVGTVDVSATGSDPYTLSRSGLTNLSVFAVGTFQALPVTWLDVYGEKHDADNIVHWSTATEINNSYFVVQVSDNGSDFTDIGRVSGQINSSEIHRYQFVHQQVKAGTHYYRVRQVDIDGKSSYSKVVKINGVNADLSAIKIYPVPSKNNVTVDVSSKRTMAVTVSVESVVGVAVSSQTQVLNYGENKINVPISQLAPGTYILKIRNDKEVLLNTKIIKQ